MYIWTMAKGHGLLDASNQGPGSSSCVPHRFHRSWFESRFALLRIDRRVNSPSPKGGSEKGDPEKGHFKMA